MNNTSASIGFTTSIIWYEYIFTDYANPIGYCIGWSLITLSISVFITSQLHELLMITCRLNRRIQPTIIN
jgi:hypothetical protein